jgi:SulP family sulfate permease
LKGYRKSTFKSDLIAGLTVAVIFVPQAIAYAYLAGMPPIYGLYAGLIPLVVYAIMGTSRHMSIGPVAVSAILVMSGVSQLADPFSDQYVALTIFAGLLIGITQIILSILRLGFLVNFLSHPVIAGFISAAAVIIIISQLKDFLGFEIPRMESSFDTLVYALENISNAHLLTAAICLGSLVIMMILKKWKKSFPSALLVVVLSTLLTWFFNWDQMGVAIIKEVPQGLPSFMIPEYSWQTVIDLLPTVFTVTFIGVVESIGIAKTLEMKHKSYVVRPNQELMALGASKVIGSFFQALPTSGSFTRSAINDNAGAKSGVASLITAFLVMLALLFLTPLFYYIPKAVLAAIILVSVYKLIDVPEARYLWKTRRRDFLTMILTFIVTLVLGIEVGVFAGIILSFILLLYTSSLPHVVEIGNIKGTNVYKNIKRFPEAIVDRDLLAIRFDNQLIFSNANYFKDSIKSFLLKREHRPKYLILDASNIHDMDSTGVHALKDVNDILIRLEIQLYICGATGPVRDILKRSGFMDELGMNRQFLHVYDAVTAIESPNENIENNNHATQYNQRKNRPI